MSDSEYDAQQAQPQEGDVAQAEPDKDPAGADVQNEPQNDAAGLAAAQPDAGAGSSEAIDALPPVSVDQTPEIFEETRATEAWGKRRMRERDLRRMRMKAWLVVRRESTVGARIDVDQDKLVIGRDADRCDIVLSGDAVSRTHARIERSPAGYYSLVDCNSRNGVYVDGRPIERMNLVNGDIFEIGLNILEFHTKEQ